jgi:NADPH:quinone reductase-like Zn-dependent oxidoreductase
VVGYESAGIIDALGPGVSNFAIGDRVWALSRFNSHAELVCTPAAMARRMPDSLSFEHAAAIPVVYATALLLVSDFGHLREGERVLIHMAAGGVGLAAIQLCRRIKGVTLYGTASASKHALLKQHGLDHAIDYRTQDFETEVMRLTNNKGVHLILDAMGGSNWKKNYRVLSPLGRLMVFGLANATKPGSRSLIHAIGQIIQQPLWTPMKLMNENKAVMGLNLGHMFEETEVIQGGLNSMASLIADGTIKPTIDQVFPFSKVADAHRRIEERQNVGKIVLTPDS